MLVMIGASASGKTEIAKKLIDQHGFHKMITYTTRPPRPMEHDGIDYHFLTQKAFLKKEAAGDFIETVTYNHHLYGTAFKDTSPDKVLIVDPSGANVLYEKLNGAVVLFFIESPENLRRLRMSARGDQPADIENRIQKDAIRFKKENMKHIDYIINNETASLDKLTKTILSLYRRHLQTS